MSAKPSPVTPAVLGWALDEDGRGRRALSEALDVDPDTLDAWLAGDARPTRGQVTALAKVLRRPRAVFFLPRPPTASTLPASFRHPPGDERLVSVEARRRVRQARRVQQAVSWALADRAGVDLPQAITGEPVEATAGRAREWLTVSDDDQAGWRDDYAALRSWRAALERREILVFALDVGRGDVRGFSAWDPQAPLIVANSAGVNPAARMFTLMHELGHLVLRQDAACIEATAAGVVTADVETWCERFSAAVLMPEAPTREWADARIGPRGSTIADVKAMTRRFRVSARAAALRLITLGYAGPDLYGEVSRVFVPKPPGNSARVASPQRAMLRQRQFGDRVLRIILNELPPRDALSILRLGAPDARRLVELVPGVREL